MNHTQHLRVGIGCLSLLASLHLAQPAQALDPDDASTLHAFLEEHLPAAAVELDALRVEDPVAYEEAVEEHIDYVAYLQALQDENQDAFEAVIRAEQLEMESWDLAAQIVDTPDADQRAELRQRLRNLLAQVFDARMLEQEAEIDAMTEELEAIKALMAQRHERKSEIVDLQTERMIQDMDDVLEWW